MAGTSPIFHGAVLLLSTGLTAASVVEGKVPGALLSAGVAVYFALRLFGGLGRRP